MWGGRRVSRAGVAALTATLALAGVGSAAYQVSSRKSAHADVPATVPAPVSLTASVLPAAVTYGADVRVSGVVRDAAGAPLAARPVDVLAARTDALAAAQVVASVVSDGAGRVSTTFRPAASSAVWLRFAGEPGLATAVSGTVRVGVARRVTVRGTSRADGGAWSTRIDGAVDPAVPGTVRLERRAGTGWRAVATGKVAKAGSYAFTVRNPAGRHAYRVVSVADAAFDAGDAPYDLRLGRLPAAPAGPGTPGTPARPVKGRLLVAGDSLAFYLGQQLATARGARPTAVESRHSSGLARREYFDWVGTGRRLVAAAPPDAVVLFLGGNDCQPIRANWTGAWTSVGTPAWAAEYQRRAAELMTAVGGNGARPVYWIGLPTARKADIASCYRMLNAASTAAAASLRGVTWIDSWSVYAVDGKYSDTIEGVVARQEDGIHLTFEGTRFLTRKVLPILGG